MYALLGGFIAYVLVTNGHIGLWLLFVGYLALQFAYEVKTGQIKL